MSARLKRTAAALRRRALAYPETREDFPWGESAFKVRDKVFLFLSLKEDGLGLSMKLPRSREFALEYGFTQPTGYGLGRAGWVSSRFGAEDDPPLDILTAWLDESWRAVAPKRLAATLASPPGRPK